MGWATNHIQELLAGNKVTIKPRGNSMEPRIKSGQECVIVPITESLRVDDVVLCRVKGREYLHKICAIDRGRYQIGNNKGRINGWIGMNSIFGKLDNQSG